MSHFSSIAETYRKYRPQYPDELFVYLASLVKEHDHVLDVGAGNGQATIKLAEYFKQVTATDVSAEQIAHAMQKENVAYKVAPAHESCLPDQSVNMVTAATAAHWFATDAFHAEARRVLRPNGVIALWCYYVPTINPSIDVQVKRYYFEILDAYWPPETYYARGNYDTLPFPFQAIETPSFRCVMHWKLENLFGFLRSFSPSTIYEKQHGTHPVDVVAEDMKKVWGDSDKEREVNFPLFMKIARV